MILGSGGNCENLSDTAFNFRFTYYTIISNKVHPNKIVKIPTTTRYHLKKTSIDEAWRWTCMHLELEGRDDRRHTREAVRLQ